MELYQGHCCGGLMLQTVLVGVVGGVEVVVGEKERRTSVVMNVVGRCGILGRKNWMQCLMNGNFGDLWRGVGGAGGAGGAGEQ